MIIKGNKYYFSQIAIDHIKFSCYGEQYFFGLDFVGQIYDLYTFDEHPFCDIYESIRFQEQLKQQISSDFLKHISTARNIYIYDIEVLCLLNLNNQLHTDLLSWIENVKCFYFIIITNETFCNKLSAFGIDLTQLEESFKRLIQFEEFQQNKLDLDYLN